MTPRFDNRLLRELPGDPIADNHRRQVRGACWSPVQPTPVSDPRLVAFSPEVAADLGLDEDTLRSPAWLAALSGNGLIDGMEPWSNNYGGHQFGTWAGQLGDGRAVSLGELEGPAGRAELQLKGAGPTPYSRGGDGRAVLRSSLREFLCSEAMFHLGVPTTRALSLVRTGDRSSQPTAGSSRPCSRARSGLGRSDDHEPSGSSVASGSACTLRQGGGRSSIPRVTFRRA